MEDIKDYDLLTYYGYTPSSSATHINFYNEDYNGTIVNQNHIILEDEITNKE